MKRINEYERQGRKGNYIEWEDKVAPVTKIKSCSANAPKGMILKSVWKHPDYNKLIKQKIKKSFSRKLK